MSLALDDIFTPTTGLTSTIQASPKTHIASKLQMSDDALRLLRFSSTIILDGTNPQNTPIRTKRRPWEEGDERRKRGLSTLSSQLQLALTLTDGTTAKAAETPTRLRRLQRLLRLRSRLASFRKVLGLRLLGPLRLKSRLQGPSWYRHQHRFHCHWRFHSSQPPKRKYEVLLHLLLSALTTQVVYPPSSARTASQPA